MGDGSVQVIPQGNVVYAQPQAVNSNYTPEKVDQFIGSIEFGEDGQFLLTTSSLNKRSWTGDIWWFARPEDAPDRDKALTGHTLDSGVVKARSVGKNQFVIGLDSGGVQLVSMNNKKHETKEGDFHYFEIQSSLCEHDDRLTDLDTWNRNACGDNHLVSVCSAGRVVVWNRNLALQHNFYPAHSAGIIGVSCHPKHNNIFATVGLDGLIKVWDTKDAKPCRTVYSDPLMPPSRVSWCPNAPNTLLVATKTGSVLLLNTDNKNIESSLEVSDSEIKSLRWCPSRPTLCALSGDDVSATVVNVEGGSNLSQQYTDNTSHSDFVSGLAWDGDTLWTAGWDKKVIAHTVS